MVEDFDNVLAIIPARRESKRLPGKNKTIFLGKPLWLNTVNIAKKAGIKNIIVSTDDEEILSTKVEGVLMLERSKHNATDVAKTEDVINEVISFIDAAAVVNFDTICLLQCTSPCLNPKTLNKALELFYIKRFNNLISVNQLYKPSGNFYIINYKSFKCSGTFWNEDMNVYIIDNFLESIDVDYIWDLYVASAVKNGKVVR